MLTSTNSIDVYIHKRYTKGKRWTSINRIIYAEQLAKELIKHPEMPIIVGKSGDKLGRFDQSVINTEVRDGVLVLNIENYKENGYLKYFR